MLCVSARQEGRGSCKEFEQKFTIPSGVNIEKLSSSLSKAGVNIYLEIKNIPRKIDLLPKNIHPPLVSGGRPDHLRAPRASLHLQLSIGWSQGAPDRHH